MDMQMELKLIMKKYFDARNLDRLWIGFHEIPVFDGIM